VFYDIQSTTVQQFGTTVQQFNRTPCNNSTNLVSCTDRQTLKLHSFIGKQNECKCVLVLTNLCRNLNNIASNQC